MKFRFIILAAGKGTRMQQQIPKALTPLGGKPILQYLYESVIHSGLDSTPIIVVGPERPELCSGWNGMCEYVVQEKQLGTANAVHVCRESVGDAQSVIVLYGDHPFVSSETLRALADLHEKTHSVLSIMTTTVPSFEQWPNYLHWGRIVRDDQYRIRAIREYKDASESERSITEVNPALYCFDTVWLWNHIGEIKNENANGEYYLTDLVELAVIQGHTIASTSIPLDEAIGINTPQERDIAEAVLKKRTSHL